ncbi:MAG: hypothetical protein R3E66_04400 [bacterium]
MKLWQLSVIFLYGCAHAPSGPVTTVELYRGKPTQIACAATGPCAATREGVKREEGTLEAGKPVGRWRFYDAQGVLREEGDYVDGLRHGTWHYHGVFVARSGNQSIELTTRPYENSETDATGDYVNGVMKGPWSLTGPQGTTVYPMSGDVFRDGFVTLEGPFLQMAPDGTKVTQGQYENAQAVGEWRTWFPDGRLKSIRNPPNGRFIDFYPSGAKHREGTLAGEVEVWNSNYLEWHEEMPLLVEHGQGIWRYATKQDVDGNPVTDLGKPCPDGTIVAGAVDGLRVEQWCQQASTSQIATKHGPFRVWSIEWGLVLEEGSFANGQRDGVWRSFNDDETEVTTYKAGKKDGEYFVRRANQQLKVAGAFAGDAMHGDWTYYNANGQPERVEKWKNGKRVD